MFKNSQAVSLIKRKSHFLARLSKKSADQIVIEKLEEEKKESEYKVRKLEESIDTLHNRIDQMIALRQNDDENTEKLKKLFKPGVIDENGNLINNNMN